MNREKLTKWDFERELLKIPARCKKLTNKTARQKVSEVFSKYDFLISYDEPSRDHYKDLFYKHRNMFNALKSGTVKYEGGFFMLNQILKIKIDENAITVYFINGENLKLVKDYEWLNDLF